VIRNIATLAGAQYLITVPAGTKTEYRVETTKKKWWGLCGHTNPTPPVTSRALKSLAQSPLRAHVPLQLRLRRGASR